jgi:hypothetical protein
LVTGLSAVAVIGMASGYTLAGKSKAQQINNPVNNTPQVALQTSQDSSQSALAPVAPIPNIAATPAPVIVVPVPQATAATPGNSTNNWQQQQSSGSR